LRAYGYFIFLCVQPSFAQNPADSGLASQPSSSLVKAQAGEELYSDDFSSSKSGWGMPTTGKALRSYQNGTYLITIVPTNYWDGYAAPRQNFTDFIAEVEATKEAGPDDNVFGLMIRNKEPGTFYAFLISSDGYFQFAEKENKTWVTPSNWTKSSAIKKGDATNLITVVAKKDQFAFYANDVLLSNYSDNSTAYGGLGPWVGTQGEGNVTIGFDNLKVWALKD